MNLVLILLVMDVRLVLVTRDRLNKIYLMLYKKEIYMLFQYYLAIEILKVELIQMLKQAILLLRH